MGRPRKSIIPQVNRDTKWVYFCQAETGGPIKIGVAIDPRMRLWGLQNASPVKLRMLAIMRGGVQMERELHTRFAEHRLHGEWFNEDAPGLAELIAEAQEAIRLVASERLPELERDVAARDARIKARRDLRDATEWRT